MTATANIGSNELRATKNFVHVNFYMNRGVNILLEGGSRSGKTYAICMALCLYVIANRGKVITIARDTRENLKITAYETLKKVWQAFGLPIGVFNKNMSTIHYNGNTIRFVGVNDDPDKALGAEQHVLWGNEWITAEKSVSDQMEQRTSECVIFDYNPSEVECWLYKLENSPNWRMLKTTLLDNPYVPEKHKRKILSYEPTPENIEAGTANQYMWLVYGLGQRAVGEDSIFPDGYTLWKDEDLPNGCDWQIYGGDFGWTNDATALIQITKTGNRLYLKEMIYERGLLNPHIAAKMKALNIDDELSAWDNSTADAKELRGLDINAIPIPKKPYVYVRLEKLKQFSIFVHEDSVNLQKEFDSAKWDKDKHNNYKTNSLSHRVMKEQRDNDGNKLDNALDAIGYGMSIYLDMSGLEKNHE